MPQPRPQGLLGIFQNGGSLYRRVTRHFEKYPEGPGDEVDKCVDIMLPSVGGMVTSPCSAENRSID